MFLRKMLWFSRHAPSEGQMAEAEQRGWEIVGLEDGMALGRRYLRDEDDVDRLCRDLHGAARRHQATGIIGVWAVPMLELMAQTANKCIAEGTRDWEGLMCAAAWNSARPPVDGKPQFAHRKFSWVGHLREGVTLPRGEQG